MKIPLSWLADHVDVDLEPEELARRLTFAGLEVEGITYVGRSQPAGGSRVAKVDGLEWERERVVVGDLLEVAPHPDADRLVLATIDDGEGRQTVVTGAPNLFEHRGRGPLERPLKVAFARQGARLYDGHAPGRQVTKLRRAKIRGVSSAGMACSEKELGISDEHEGVILLGDDAPAAGTPLADHMGDVVFDVSLTPNMARNACVLGVAREVSALTGAPLRRPSLEVEMTGPPIEGAVAIEIRESRLNPRFTLTLLEGVEIGPSPYWMQLRLRLAGMRPINNVVDVTNYVMLELGQPLHAFDYDVLRERARASGAETPTIVTRLPTDGETLKTLDGASRELDPFTILVADTLGALSLGGIMGGAESEVEEGTTAVLLEAAAWDLINVRRSVQAQSLQTSEAGYRFSRGVHPAQALRGNLRAVELMRRLTGATVRRGYVDAYPAPPEPAVVDLPTSEISRYLGVEIPKETAAAILESLEFGVEDRGESLRVTAPDHRLDVGTGAVGVADVIEEVARIWGYERIPETQIADQIPPQRGNPELEREEELRDLVAGLGFQEVITYRLTAPEREARATAGEPDDAPYVTLANPIVQERVAMRRSLLASVLEVAASNARHRGHLALFEIGKVYLPADGEDLPREPRRLALLLSGPRQPESWTGADREAMDFYDLKGVVEEIAAALHLEAAFEAGEHPSFHPARTARLRVGGDDAGFFGELHPRVREAYELPEPTLAAELDLEALLAAGDGVFQMAPIPTQPPVVEDLAVVIDESVPAAAVAAAIAEAGGELLAEARLFDLYRGEQLGAGKKSLAYRLTYRSPERTLTDEDAARVRRRILERLEHDLGAVLRGG